MEKNALAPMIRPKKNKGLRIAKICGLIFGFALLAVLTVHSMICVFKDDYYPTFGKYRLFSVVTDSMEPVIPTGSMIVCAVPSSEDEIEVGDVITYQVKIGETTTLYTHRVIEVRVSDAGAISYTTKGDNAPDVDAFRPRFQNIVGVYTGRKCGFFGYFFGFLRSTEGAIALIIVSLISVLAYVVVRFVNLVNAWRRVAIDALAKSRGMLAETHDEQMGTIADVIGIVAKDPEDKADLKRKDKKLGRFLRTGELPKRPYSNDIDEDEDAEIQPKKKGAADLKDGIDMNKDDADKS